MERRIRTFFFIGLSLFCLLAFLVVNDISYRFELQYRNLQLTCYQLATDWHRMIGSIRGTLYVIEPLEGAVQASRKQVDQVSARLNELTNSTKGMDPEILRDVASLMGSIQSGMNLSQEILNTAELFLNQKDLPQGVKEGKIPMSALLGRDVTSVLKPEAEFYYFQLVQQLKEMNAFFDDLHSQHMTRLLEVITDRTEGLRQGFSITRLVVLVVTTLMIVVMVGQLFALNAYLRRLAHKANEDLVSTQKSLDVLSQNLQNIKFQQSLFEMVTGVAHELNTPLGNSVTTATFIEGRFRSLLTHYQERTLSKQGWEKLVGECLEGFQILTGSLSRMKGQIDTFKQLAAVNHDTGRQVMGASQYLAVRVPQLAKEISLDLKVTSHLKSGRDFRLAVENLDFIFLELFQNAVIHGAAPAVDIEFTRDGEMLLIRFQDQGKGVAPEFLKRLAEPFFTTARNQRHMGLGLSIVLSLVVNKLHGNLDFQTGNPGLVVSLSLPLEKL